MFTPQLTQRLWPTIDRFHLRLVPAHIRFCETDEPEKPTSRLLIARCTTKSTGSGPGRERYQNYPPVLLPSHRAAFTIPVTQHTSRQRPEHFVCHSSRR